MRTPYRCVHIAGTNGKGSTAAYTAGILLAAGYKCGMYTSPHILRPEERIRVDGQEIPSAQLERLLAEAQGKGEGKTFFHAYTYAAFQWFEACAVDFAVLETGLGGRLDPTNVAEPQLCILTQIGIDHAALLGGTLEKIAYEKAGIIKPGVPVVTCEQPPEAMAVIKQACAEKNAPLTVINDAQIEINRRSLEGQVFSLNLGEKRLESLRIAQLGLKQPQNAALAAAAALKLGVPEAAIRQGLSNVHIPARFEVLPGEPPVILDGAHNVDSALALEQTLNCYFKERKRVLFAAVMADKDVPGIAAVFSRIAGTVFTVQADKERGLSAQALAEEFCRQGAAAHSRAEIAAAFKEAAEAACRQEAVLVAAGSFYLAGKLRTLLA